jgi:hypothetical protein
MNGEPTPEPSIGDIIDEAAATERAAASSSSDDVKALADRLELLAADFGRWETYKAASTQYVTEFTTEMRWHRRIRLAVSIACALLVLFLATVLVVALCRANTLFGESSGHALTALIVATVTGCVVVMIATIKGAFQTMADRNAGLPTPDHMKEIVDAARDFIGASKG